MGAPQKHPTYTQANDKINKNISPPGKQCKKYFSKNISKKQIRNHKFDNFLI